MTKYCSNIKYDKFINENIYKFSDLSSIGGMTNNNFILDIYGERCIIRMPGYKTEYLINRNYEKYNTLLIQKLMIDAKLLYFNENNGIKISKFISNSSNLTKQSARDIQNMRLSAEILNTLHTSNIEFINRFNVFEEIIKYEKLIKIDLNKVFDEYSDFREKVLGLERYINTLGIDIKPCHNDTVPENFIKDTKNNRLYLTDWEYSGMNDPMWDLAGYILECELDEVNETIFLKEYFNSENIDNSLYIKINIFKICQDFLWSLWAVVKNDKGDTLLNYGINRYNRLKYNLRKLCQIKL